MSTPTRTMYGLRTKTAKGREEEGVGLGVGEREGKKYCNEGVVPGSVFIKNSLLILM